MVINLPPKEGDQNISILHIIAQTIKTTEMATLTQEMKDMIATQQCFVGTDQSQ